MRPTLVLLFLTICFSPLLSHAQTPPQRNYPAPVEGDYVISKFHFHSGEILPELKMHYRTIGTLQRDTSGVARNAILIGTNVYPHTATTARVRSRSRGDR